MLTKLNIPKKINVGFQTRPDTYTKKLAFVVYTDAKGVLRKEKSWNGWRDKKIDPQEFDNTPVSGFVLNKKVGGYRSGWNSRGTYVRIYDPRGDFEFEISVANLLFILEETSSIKGKGLEGEFVYSWDGTELVLLPANSQEYQASSDFTELQTKKVTAKEMTEGCLYLNKDNEQVMYLGRHDWYEVASDYKNGYQRYIKQSKQHIFVSVDGKSTYWLQTGFTKLGSKLSQEPSPLFAEEFEKFKNSNRGSEPVGVISQPFKVSTEKSTYNQHYDVFIAKNDNFYPIQIRGDYNGKYTISEFFDPVKITPDHKINIPYHNYTRQETVVLQDLENMNFVTLAIKNKNGTLIQI